MCLVLMHQHVRCSKASPSNVQQTGHGTITHIVCNGLIDQGNVKRVLVAIGGHNLATCAVHHVSAPSLPNSRLSTVSRSKQHQHPETAVVPLQQ
jgi:hypothetical protein